MRNVLDREAFFEILKEQSKPFHSSNGITFAKVRVHGCQEIIRINSRNFRRYSKELYFNNTSRIPTANFLKDIIAMIDAVASSGPAQEVFIRIAEIGKAIYIDMCNEQRQQVRISPEGWEIINSTDSPACFIRPKRLLALATPQRGGSLHTFKQFCHLENENHFTLLIAFLVGALQSSRPCPHLTIQGEQGSGKSWLGHLIADLIDPKQPFSTNLPCSERELAINVCNCWLPLYDNASRITGNISDALCKLVTGGGFVTRALFTNGEEAVFTFRRTFVTNGITEFVQRPDLCDRTIFIRTKPIPSEKRCPEYLLAEQWNAARPKILGALYDAVSAALKHIDNTKLPTCPRMADFVHWVVAAEKALPWNSGQFVIDYEQNRLLAIDDAIAADPVASSIMKLMQSTGYWSGTPTALMSQLALISPDEVRCSNGWPRQANMLSSKLKRCMTFLRERSVSIEFSKSGQRNITIRSTVQPPPYIAPIISGTVQPYVLPTSNI